MLTCACYESEEPDWWWHVPEDYTRLPTKRRQRCKSCWCLIDVGATCAKFARSRGPKDEIENRIYGEDSDDIQMAAWWFCERCADLYFSLTELGYCIDPQDDMRELVKEYAEIQAMKVREFPCG